MKQHTQDLIKGQLVEITLHNKQVLREVVVAADLIGVILNTYAVDRSGAHEEFRILPWSSILDLAIVSTDAPGLINDHRYHTIPLDNKFEIVAKAYIHEEDEPRHCHICEQNANGGKVHYNV